MFKSNKGQLQLPPKQTQPIFEVPSPSFDNDVFNRSGLPDKQRGEEDNEEVSSHEFSRDDPMDQPLFQSSLIVQTKPESPSANNQKVKVIIMMIDKIDISLERVHQGQSTDNVDAKQTARRACQSTYFNFDAT